MRGGSRARWVFPTARFTFGITWIWGQRCVGVLGVAAELVLGTEELAAGLDLPNVSVPE